MKEQELESSVKTVVEHSPHYPKIKGLSSDLYYKPITIVNDDSSIINKLQTSLIDDARVIIYDCHIFIVQATASTTGTGREETSNYDRVEPHWHTCP
jgi:hypothetical protein